MLDIKFIRENLQTVKTGLSRRNGNNHDLDALLKPVSYTHLRANETLR